MRPAAAATMAVQWHPLLMLCQHLSLPPLPPLSRWLSARPVVSETSSATAGARQQQVAHWHHHPHHLHRHRYHTLPPTARARAPPSRSPPTRPRAPGCARPCHPRARARTAPRALRHHAPRARRHAHRAHHRHHHYHRRHHCCGCHPHRRRSCRRAAWLQVGGRELSRLQKAMATVNNNNYAKESKAHTIAASLSLSSIPLHNYRASPSHRHSLCNAPPNSGGRSWCRHSQTRPPPCPLPLLSVR